MSDQETIQKNAGNYSRSLGSGIRSLVGAKGRTYCILEHKNNSERYKVGQIQEIIVDYAEMGRDPRCQVYFGESFPTVSRHHAALVRQGDQWLLKHLSKTNPTLINGRPVANQWFLQNGDEIQLSVEGPRIGFYIPGNPKMNSLSMSRRFSLFRQQSLRPYRRAMIALGIILVLLIAGGTVVLTGLSGRLKTSEKTQAQQQETINAQQEVIGQQKQVISKLNEDFNDMLAKSTRFRGDIDSLNAEVQAAKASNKMLAQNLKDLENIIKQPGGQNVSRNTEVQPVPGPNFSVPMDDLMKDIYYIEATTIHIEFNGETVSDNGGWRGTAFLLSDSTFVTARHVVEPWSFSFETVNGEISILDTGEFLINILANSGGKVNVDFIAYSPDGSEIKLKNKNFKVNTSDDDIISEKDEEGNIIVLRKCPEQNDWATFRLNKSGGLDFDDNLAENLKAQYKLHTLSYPLGLGKFENEVKPLYGSCIVGSTGLYEGMIQVGDINFEHGSSGGPVFYLTNEGKYTVVGIITLGIGGQSGFLVPISAIH